MFAVPDEYSVTSPTQITGLPQVSINIEVCWFQIHSTLRNRSIKERLTISRKRGLSFEAQTTSAKQVFLSAKHSL